MANSIGMEAIVEIDENERYWVGNGFGKGGLLPTDRGAFTTTDGSIFWKSTKEASEDLLLLGRGWVLEKNGDFLPTRPDQPDDCWMYATDFRAESVADAKPNKGALHWVRFRRLVRVKLFHPDEFVAKEIYERCDHCDSGVVETVSRLFLDVLAYTSLLHNKTHAPNSVTFPLKNTIMDLAVSQEVVPNQNAHYQLQMLRKKLENFIEKERSKTATSRIISGINFSFPGRHGQKEFDERCNSIEAECLTKAERDAIAGLLVRKLDPQFEVHCDVVGCGQTCRYARVQCPNEGCSEIMSRNYLEAHDSECPFKIIHCDCGDEFRASEILVHQSDACKLRIVECPFKSIGCIKEVKARDLEHHVTEDMASHLLLAVSQIHQQQEQIQNLHSALVAVQTENQTLEQKLQDQRQETDKASAELQSKLVKLTRDFGDFQKSCKNEIKRLHTAPQSLT